MLIYNCPKGTEDNNRQGRGQAKPQGERSKNERRNDTGRTKANGD